MQKGFRIIASMLCLVPCITYAQVRSGRVRAITERVNEEQRVSLSGNTRKEAIAANDRGRLADDYALSHMHLQLKRSPAEEKAVQKTIDDLSNPASATYHQWMTASEYGDKLGLASEDTDELSSWLTARGFTVHSVSPAHMWIDFSGTAGQIRAAFRTELHRIEVDGESHIANMSDPQVPRAFAPAVAGIVGLHNFFPRPANIPRQDYNPGNGQNLIVPGDLATIYNLNPLFAAGIAGAGQTIAVIEDSNMYSTTDWALFRKTMGLTLKYPKGTFAQVHPGPGATGTAGPCSDPGVNGDDGEATLDGEWASAAAPNAAIILASCGNTSNFGGFIAFENMLTNGSTPPTIVSISYADSESDNGAAGNAYANSLYQLAVSEGVSVFVASGDWGAAVSDAGFPASTARFGINVNGLASTPNDVAVGGTDFADAFFGNTSTYWSSTNGPNFTSAKSYVPEVPWNDSCGSFVLAEVEGFSTTYGSNGLCNSTLAANNGWLNFIAGSGGPSACAFGVPTTTDVVSGSCAGYPKPIWQAGFAGIQNDGVRDVPDVSLFASNGFLGHYYVVCFSDPARRGAPCVATSPATWAGFGGTSVATPIMAGMQALVNQKTGVRQGNPVSTYYALAATEYGASGNANCNSSTGNAASAGCIFYDVTLGDIDVPCTGAFSCFMPSGSVGVVSTSNNSYLPAFTTTNGWDFATGIGTVNAYNLVMNWPTGGQ